MTSPKAKNRKIENEIDSEEKFQPFVQVDEKAVFIEYNPKLAIEKFMKFSEIPQFEEKYFRNFGKKTAFF